MKNINDVDDFNEYCQEVLEHFINSLMLDKRYTEDYVTYDDNVIKIFNSKGTALYERFYSRLHSVGVKYFYEDELELTPSNYVEDINDIW